jgi:catechol 2,3-dioxygenase-like lactoylglutathione lyase family enzyme
MKYRNAVPVISTADVRATVAYYTRVLGFAEHFIFGDPPVYAGIERDGVLLYIARDPEFASVLKSHPDLHPEVFLWVHNVDRVFEEHKLRGAVIVEEIADRAWDARQYVIEDPSGYHLKIAEPWSKRKPSRS